MTERFSDYFHIKLQNIIEIQGYSISYVNVLGSISKCQHFLRVYKRSQQARVPQKHNKHNHIKFKTKTVSTRRLLQFTTFAV